MHCPALRRLSANSEVELRQMFMQDFDKKLEQLQRAAGHTSGQEQIDLFLKRRAHLFNLGRLDPTAHAAPLRSGLLRRLTQSAGFWFCYVGWVESTIPTMLELRQEVSPWVAAAQLHNGEHTGRQSPYDADPE